MWPVIVLGQYAQFCWIGLEADSYIHGRYTLPSRHCSLKIDGNERYTSPLRKDAHVLEAQAES